MNSKEYKCNICNKLYASYKSAWLHNKKFHKNNTSNESNDVKIEPPAAHQAIVTVNIEKKERKISLKCEYCNKYFSSRQTKYEHKLKACKYNPNNPLNANKLDILEKKNLELENSLKELKELRETNELKELRELKELLIKHIKIHPKTLQKINKNLINNTTNNNTTNNTINNTINNNIINKTYVNFYEPIDYKILSKKEIINIISKPWKSLEESIKTIHFNKKLPEYNNILITNLKDNTAYIFDGTKFSAVSKREAINDLITSHMDEIESSASEYGETISEHKLKNLNSFIDTIGDNDKKFIHETLKKTYPNYRIYKCECIKNLIYNNSDPKILEKLKTMDLENKIV